MVATQLDAISEAIGQLRAEVRNLGTTLSVANQHADEHRIAIHRRVDDLVGDVGAFKLTLDGLTTQVSVIDKTVRHSKLVTDKVEMWEQRGLGALFMAGIAGSAVGGIVIAFLMYWWDTILRLLRSAG